MIKFNLEFLEMFLGVVRKYMQLRGGLSQKDLAVAISVGISTMSRFINQKTKELDPQLIASIVAFLNIPLHEVIDFIAEESTQNFKKLVSFHKDNQKAEELSGGAPEEAADALEASGLDGTGYDDEETRYKTSATIRGVKVPFGEKSRRSTDNKLTTGEKIKQLSPRQRSFMNDFLALDMEGRDLIVDIGNQLLRHFNQSQADY